MAFSLLTTTCFFLSIIDVGGITEGCCGEMRGGVVQNLQKRCCCSVSFNVRSLLFVTACLKLLKTG